MRLRGRPPNTAGVGARLTVLGGPVPQSQQLAVGGRYCSSDQLQRTFAAGDAAELEVRVLRNDRGRLRPWNPGLLWPAPVPPRLAASAGSQPPQSLAGLTGWWNGVAAGDFDEDGRLALLASNWGWNDAAQADFERPLRVYYGDPGEHEVVDVLEAYFPEELAVEVPRRNLNALSQALPFLRARYPTHAAFSTARMVFSTAMQVVGDTIQTFSAKPSRTTSAKLACNSA